MKNRQWMGLLGAAAVIAALIPASAHAQASSDDNESKIARCRQNPSSELIWLDRAGLRARCGLWSHVNRKSGGREQIVYNRYLYVYLHKGVVTSVKKKRQIFTGFRLRP